LPARERANFVELLVALGYLDTLYNSKTEGILTRRKKIQVGILLIAIIAMAFSQVIKVRSFFPGSIKGPTQPYWKHLNIVETIEKDRAFKSHFL